MLLERVFYHYEDLEEYQQGMWKIARGEQLKEHVANAADLMRDPVAFRAAMERALTEWPKSCDANLTAESINRIAWLGHAGCCIATGSPEGATRCAWHTLDRPEQDAANEAAAQVLDLYLREKRKASRMPDLFDGGR